MAEQTKAPGEWSEFILKCREVAKALQGSDWVKMTFAATELLYRLAEEMEDADKRSIAAQDELFILCRDTPRLWWGLMERFGYLHDGHPHRNDYPMEWPQDPCERERWMRLAIAYQPTEATPR